jgi:outer membrane receptor protein involved in Fe transport
MIGTALAALAAGFVPAGAQEALETVIVTGTHIQRPNLQAVSPVTTVDSAEIKLQGVAEIETNLNRLPQFTPDANENVNNGSGGVATVNLRNLGAGRNLALIDGQRILPTEAMDLNFVPSAMVERVDVLTGGASAVYGSDAISGVVNFILNKHMNGVKIDAQYSISQHTNDLKPVRDAVDAKGYSKAPESVWNGMKYSITLAMGSDLANGRGNVSGYVGYRSNNSVLWGSRDYSSCPLVDTNGAYECLGSSQHAYGVFIPSTGPNADTAYANSKDGSKTWVPNNKSFNYNYAPLSYLQRPDRRVTAGAFGTFKVNDYIEAYANFMYMNDHTHAQIAPDAIWLGRQFQINCDNPLLSDQQKTALCGSTTSTAMAKSQVAFRMVAAPRYDDIRHEDFRFQFGLRGKLNEAFSYDVSALTARSVIPEFYSNVINQDKAALGLQVVSVGGVPTCLSVVNQENDTCVPVDVFSANGPSQKALNYIMTHKFSSATHNLTQYAVNVNGDLGTYGVTSPWANNGLALALGYEHRTEKKVFTVDALGIADGGANAEGKITNDEVYIEADLPLIENKPFVKALTLNAGYRYTIYNAESALLSMKSPEKTFATYKVQAEYAPTDDIRFRAGFNKAVRAPNTSELFDAIGVSNYPTVDPCSGPTPSKTLALCQLSGVTAAEYGHITPCPTDVCSQQTGGNPALKPEKAETITAGFVLTPTLLENFQMSFDYYNIRVAGYIANLDANIVLTQCFDSQNPYYCGLVHRDHTSGGIIFGKNGYVIASNLNIGSMKTQGLDFTASYGFKTDGAGDFNLSVVGTYLLSQVTEPLRGLGSYDCTGLFGPVCGQSTPTWRHSTRVTWNTPFSGVQMSLNWRYIGRVSLSSNTGLPFFNTSKTSSLNSHISDYNYFDLAGSVPIGENLILRAGVNNVLDKTAPAIDNGLLSKFGNGNSYPGVYDPLGRVLFVGVEANF